MSNLKDEGYVTPVLSPQESTEENSETFYDAQFTTNRITLNPRQEIAVRRIAQYCTKTWGFMLFHKVGTGKTVTSLMAAMNSTKDRTINVTIIAPPGLFGNFTDEFEKILGKTAYNVVLNDKFNVENTVNEYKNVVKKLMFGNREVILENYPFDKLINDINNRELGDFTNKIVIIDEAHRLLNKDVYDSVQAGSSTPKHPIITDIYFTSNIYKAKKCIIMTGTPLQESLADVCKLMNFVSKSENFTVEKYAFKSFNFTARLAVYKLMIQLVKNIAFAKLPFISKTLGLTALAVPAMNAAVPYISSGYAVASACISSSLNSLSSINNSVLGTALLLPLLAYLTQKYIIPFLMLAKKQNGGRKKKQKHTLKKKYNKTKTHKLRGKKKHNKTKILKKNKTVRKLLKGGSIQDWIKTIYDAFFGIDIDDPETRANYGQAKVVYDALFAEDRVASMMQGLELLMEDDFNTKTLAADMSEYVSMYDYEVQDGLVRPTENPDIFQLKNESQQLSVNPNYIYTNTNANANTANIQNISNLYPTEDDKKNFPKDSLIAVPILYDKYQSDMLSQMFIGELSNSLKTVLNKDKFKKMDMDIKPGIKEALSNGRIVGNFSSDVERYYTILNSEKTGYDTFDRKTGSKIDYSSSTLFGCSKFDHMLKTLLEYSTGKNPNTPEKENQTHNDDNNNRYLPLVYSYTETDGLSLFAAYLNSRGYKYILIHPGQTRINKGTTTFLNYQRDLAIKQTYPSAPSFDKNNALCVLLHSSMTEGFDAKYSPAILVMEPCNIYGDQEQVYGRVLRKYAPSDLQKLAQKQGTTFDSDQFKRPIKYIHQYQCVTNPDIIRMGLKYKITQGINKLAALSKKMYKIATPFTVNFNEPIRFESPDIKHLERLRREKERLIDLEKKIRYGPTYSDIIESNKCELEKGETTRYKICDIASGEGCEQIGGEGELTVLEDTEYNMNLEIDNIHDKIFETIDFSGVENYADDLFTRFFENIDNTYNNAITTGKINDIPIDTNTMKELTS